MLARELIERLEAVIAADGPDAEVALVEDEGDRYGIGVSLVPVRLVNPNGEIGDAVTLSDDDRLISGYFGGDTPLW